MGRGILCPFLPHILRKAFILELYDMRPDIGDLMHLFGLFNIIITAENKVQNHQEGRLANRISSRLSSNDSVKPFMKNDRWPGSLTV